MADSRNAPVALITGGTSGIGYAVARELGRRGYALIICADTAESLRTATSTLEAEGIGPVMPILADLATTSGVQALHDAATACSPVDVLVANAGIGAYGDFAGEISVADDLRSIQLNVTSVVHLTKLIAADMAAHGSGKIMITSSIMAFLPDPFQCVYAATKAFTYVFAEGLRESLKDRNVSVTVLAPGFTSTPFFDKIGANRSRAVRTRFMRMGDPEDVARAACRALERGDDHVIPGTINRMIATVGKLAPDPVITRIVRKMLEPVR
jgi:short-subunit dehydrogenase